MVNITMDKLVSICKQYGFIFQGSEIYGGLANTWDYGPLGVELKNNLKKAWWKKFIQESKHSYGVDAAILMNPRVWEASGHVQNFSDPLIDCKECKSRQRADKLVEAVDPEIDGDSMSDEELYDYIVKHGIKCPKCGKSNWTKIRQFNLLFETSRGVIKDDASKVYLRGETAQGEFVNFLNVQKSMRAKLPFGIGQVGKAFRNEITPGNFTFRTVEFEQMEHQLFCKDEDSMNFYENYKQKAWDFLISLGIKEDDIRFKDHEKLVFYCKAACDIQYRFPFGFDELWGTHHRGTYDLSRHEEYSGNQMRYLDPDTNEKILPTVVESSVGADRLALAILCNAYENQSLEDGTTREVMHFHPFLAPYKAAVLPLVKKHHKEKAEEVYNMLSKDFMITYDETGNIGKRYRREDVAGTPFCITIDDETINNSTVTVRDRDTMKQDIIKVEELKDYLNEKIKF